MALLIVIINISFFVLLLVMIHQRNTYKAYYDYANKEWKRIEKKEEKLNEDKKELQMKLDDIAYLNPVTKIHNMDFFLEKGEEKRKKVAIGAYTLVTFSIANIGQINRVFGTREADKVILYVARMLMKNSKGNIYAQLQSNLFGILLENTTNQQLQTDIATFTQQAQKYSDKVPVEMIFGIYTARQTTDTIREMINNTVVAQKFVKDIKVCNFKYYNEELEATFIENKRMSEEMEQALEEHKFLMFLQPIVDLKNYQIVGAEGLVRWEYPGKGLLSPYAFLSIFESTSMVKKLDYYMWEEACKAIRRWLDNNIKPVPINVNISPIHLQNKEFVEIIHELMKKYLIDKELFVLELPERGLMDSSYDIDNILSKMKEYQLRVCVDNFGSLYSPLNLMKNDAIEMIKIDRKFLSMNTNSEEGLSLIKFLIAMAKDVDKKVITEGVETMEQADYLSKIGSDYGQGYFFSKPVDLRTFDSMKKNMIQRIFPANEFYPTFEAFEEDVDLLEKLLDE